MEPTVQSKPVASAAPVIPTAPAVPVTAAVPVAQAPATPVVPTAPVGVTAPVQASVPTSTHTYTPDELAGAAMQLMDSGRQNELLSLLPAVRCELDSGFTAAAVRGVCDSIKGYGGTDLMGDHALRNHSTLSPSNAYQWMECTPSVILGLQFPDPSSSAAEEGTLAHELAELKVRNYFFTHGFREAETERRNQEVKNERDLGR